MKGEERIERSKGQRVRRNDEGQAVENPLREATSPDCAILAGFAFFFYSVHDFSMHFPSTSHFFNTLTSRYPLLHY